MTLTSTHWGSYIPRLENGKLIAMDPVPWDTAPSAIGRSLPEGIVAPCRVRRPAIRAGFLKHRAASREGRGSEPFVELPWDEALDIVAAELRRVRSTHGNEAIYGGSYGWSSAGRFHHAQSQVHRFLNAFGGYVFSRDTYSSGAARRILPHVLAEMDVLRRSHTDWSSLARHCELFVAFGGLPTKNAQVNSGGATDHTVARWLGWLAEAGVGFVNVSPVRHDLDAVAEARWLAVRPGSDTAVMLALAHVLIAEDLYDHGFVRDYTVGFEPFRDYVLGETDGVPKTPAWAAEIADIGAEEIAGLARRMARSRTMINVAWSLQRAMQGEQPFWAAVALAALLGQIGTEGGGIGVGYSCVNDVGAGRDGFSGPRLPQGTNPVRAFIPVARLADMLLHPGEPFDYDGATLTYPDIRLIYWAGGNVFHHHQDINRLIRAWRRPECIIIHEPYWTAQAKFSDIVLPATTSLERNDIGSAAGDGFMIAMKQVVAPVGAARDDYDIFADLAARLDCAATFTEGRDTMAWLRAIYAEAAERGAAAGLALPDFDTFWAGDHIEYPKPAAEQVMFRAFRRDPVGHPLTTPSGRIEIGSATIAGFGYPECPGHPFWHPPAEWLGSPRAQLYPLHLLSNQPATRLHSQYDHGAVSRETKIQGREPILISPEDARRRGIATGDVVKVYNDRGAILAGARVSDGIRPGVVQMATGAWYDPDEPGRIGALDKHGNPNVLTPDIGTSRLGQGSAAQSALVEIVRWTGPLPPVTAFDPPPLTGRPPSRTGA